MNPGRPPSVQALYTHKTGHNTAAHRLQALRHRPMTDQFNTLRECIATAKLTKMASVRKALPLIEEAMAAGVPISSIAQALRADGVDVTPSTLTTYLSRLRRRDKARAPKKTIPDPTPAPPPLAPNTASAAAVAPTQTPAPSGATASTPAPPSVPIKGKLPPIHIPRIHKNYTDEEFRKLPFQDFLTEIRNNPPDLDALARQFRESRKKNQQKP